MHFGVCLTHLCMQNTFLKTLVRNEIHVNGCMIYGFFLNPDNDSIITRLQIHLHWQSCPEDIVTLMCYNSKTKQKQNKFNNSNTIKTPDISWELVASLFMASERWQSEWWQSDHVPVSAIELLYQYSVQRNHPETRTTLIQCQWQHYFLSHLWSLIQM